jgi:outer membrane receptor protein involved in Fe transport
MINKNFKQILTTILVLLVSASVYAQGTLSGTVKSSGGDALDKVYISIPALGVGALTNKEGDYNFANVPAGRYSVEASATGMENEVEYVTVANKTANTVNFIMGRANRSIKDVIITGVTNPKSSLESSISISTLKATDVQNSVPRTTAEIFRTIPGIRSESSGGDGNSNITVRGVPVSAGGSRYMMIQEDGLPVLQFGDMAFATQDQFLRYDNNVNRIEAVRGGSASVLTSNSPAGIINFISKTGDVTGGSIATTIGIDNRMYRTDFEYGSALGNDMTFHVGGFYRNGDGPRRTGYTSNNGGQIKGNITKRYSNGYVRLNFKMLDDRAAAYMPMPIKVSGTDAAPVWESLTHYSATHGALQSPFLQSDRTIGGDGNILQTDVTDGMHAKTKSIGAEFNFNIGGGWKLADKARYAVNNGQFVAPFPANAGSYSDILGGVSGAKSLVYAGTTTQASGDLMRIHLFNTTLNNFNNYINDISISKKFKDITVNAGVYKSLQNVSMDWHWNTYLMEANSDSLAVQNRMVDALDSAGNKMSQNGLLAYGTPAWGNCCNRKFDTHYDITAPYINVEIAPMDQLTIDGGVRYDYGHVYGSFAGGNGQTAAIDMNGNGTIDANEMSVATQSNKSTPVNYTYKLTSYSFGANYMLDVTSSAFLRQSYGGTASADRALFNGWNYVGNNDPYLNASKVNTVSQTELGYKYRKNKISLNATYFRAITKEGNYELTSQKTTFNNYLSQGLELDAVANIASNFNIRGGLTYTRARITNAMDTSIIGHTPRRLPAVMFNITPVYTINGGHKIGFTMLAFSKSFAQDNNKLVMPGYMVFNPFVTANLMKNFTLTLAGNNAFNALGITESEEGSLGTSTSTIVRARPITGRSFSMSLRYNF